MKKIFRIDSQKLPRISDPKDIIAPEFKSFKINEYELGKISSVSVRRSNDGKDFYVDIEYQPNH